MNINSKSTNTNDYNLFSNSLAHYEKRIKLDYSDYLVLVQTLLLVDRLIF